MTDPTPAALPETHADQGQDQPTTTVRNDMDPIHNPVWSKIFWDMEERRQREGF